MGHPKGGVIGRIDGDSRNIEMSGIGIGDTAGSEVLAAIGCMQDPVLMPDFIVKENAVMVQGSKEAEAPGMGTRFGSERS